MDKLTSIKIIYENQSVPSDPIPIGVLAENVDWSKTRNLVNVLGTSFANQPITKTC